MTYGQTRNIRLLEDRTKEMESHLEFLEEQIEDYESLVFKLANFYDVPPDFKAETYGLNADEAEYLYCVLNPDPEIDEED